MIAILPGILKEFLARLAMSKQVINLHAILHILIIFSDRQLALSFSKSFNEKTHKFCKLLTGWLLSLFETFTFIRILRSSRLNTSVYKYRFLSHYSHYSPTGQYFRPFIVPFHETSPRTSLGSHSSHLFSSCVYLRSSYWDDRKTIHE